MELTQLYKDDDAVSPVIGVILMVAITVILAAVIASFVMGLGPSANDQQPTASFNFDYEADDNTPDYGLLTISHQSGDTIEAQELHVRGSGFEDASNADYTTSAIDLGDAGAFSEDDGDGPNDYDATDGVSSGNRLVVGVEGTYEIDVVWESPEGDNSATLSSDDGPDA